MVISRFTTISAAAVSVLAATLLASPTHAAAGDRAECTSEQRETARRMLRAECPYSVTASATVFCSWYGAVEISNIQC